MDMEWKATIMDEAQLQRCVARIAHEIVERNQGTGDICLLGIKRRGIPLAERIAEKILQFEGVRVPVGHIDIALYRDDLTELSALPDASDCVIPCVVRDTTFILVDDVLYPGRTARAAIDAVMHFGRPKAIQLAVLIDRGHRELPIRPDFVGKNIPTAKSEVVCVRLHPVDEENSVELFQR